MKCATYNIHMCIQCTYIHAHAARPFSHTCTRYKTILTHMHTLQDHSHTHAHAARPFSHTCTCCTQIVVHGTSDATNHLVDFSKKVLLISDEKVFAPHIGECVNATTESHIYQVNDYLCVYIRTRTHKNACMHVHTHIQAHIHTLSHTHT